MVLVYASALRLWSRPQLRVSEKMRFFVEGMVKARDETVGGAPGLDSGGLGGGKDDRWDIAVLVDAGPLITTEALMPTSVPEYRANFRTSLATYWTWKTGLWYNLVAGLTRPIF